MTATALGDLLAALGVVGWTVNSLLLHRANAGHRLSMWRRPVDPLPLVCRTPAAVGSGLFVFGASYGYGPGKWIFDASAFVTGVVIMETVRRRHNHLLKTDRDAP